MKPLPRLDAGIFASTICAEPMNKKKDRPVYEALLVRIKSGEITRRQAAIASTITGLSESTFMSWLRASRVIKEPEMKATRRNAGQNYHFAHKDPDKIKAYEQAVVAVIGGINPTRASRQFNVNYPYLNIKVKKERERIEDERRRIEAERPMVERIAKEELERLIIEACTPVPKSGQIGPVDQDGQVIPVEDQNW